MKYRKKPITIEAVQYTGGNYDEIKKFAQKNVRDFRRFIVVSTLKGCMVARPGDYIIKGVIGEFYPCKPDIFRMTYEEAE